MSFEPHQPRASLYPGGYGMRLLAMIGVLTLIGATIYQMRNQALAARAARKVQGAAEPAETEDPQAKWSETIVANPGDDSPIEQEDAQRLFSVVGDKQGIGLLDVDMPAYWRLMKWSRARSFADLEERAARDVPFTQLWEEPAKHRGELIRLRIHVQRIIAWDAPENSLGVKKTYEIWGGTEESRGNPYCVTCAELPPGLRVASETTGEIVFAGFFHKILAYEVMGKTRGAPMLIGRIRVLDNGARLAANRSLGLTTMLIIGAAVVGALIIVVAMYRVTRRGRVPPLKPGPPVLENSEVESWLRNIPDDESPPAAEAAGVHATNGKGDAHH
jgi:hypothetical protein